MPSIRSSSRLRHKTKLQATEGRYLPRLPASSTPLTLDLARLPLPILPPSTNASPLFKDQSIDTKSKSNHSISAKMTIPQIEGLQVEVKDEGKGTYETKAGEFSRFTPPLARLQAASGCLHIRARHSTVTDTSARRRDLGALPWYAPGRYTVR